MIYLLAENISKSYGEKLLFEDITFGVERGHKVALVAKNGSGKTTLLNIIAGKEIADEGKIVLRNDIKVAYLEQNPQFNPSLKVIDILYQSENKFIKAIRNYSSAIKKLEKDHSEENQKAFDEASAQMDALQAWDYEVKAREVLSKLKIENVEQHVGELSGGQKKKIALAATLIDEIDLLIMDEPTNHLDIEMIEWLEEFLSASKLSLLLVTHDRYFLDSICDEIIELENQQVYKYKGNYSYYVEKKAEREALLEAEVTKARNIYRTELDWMRRMPKARTHKSKSRIESFYDVEKKAKTKIDKTKVDFQVKTERIGKKILELNNVFKSYGEKKLLEDFSYTFKRGEKIGIVGPNGCGKSTLFNMIMGHLRPDNGKIVTGQTVKFGYYSQEGLKNSEDKRVIEIVKEIADVVQIEGGKMSASQFLFRFGFSETTQYNYFSNLSGGERRKLFLLMTLMQNPNFLILDEPTNDLDIYTLNLLEEFLMNFEGCLMIASHDRFLLDKLADHLFVFEGNGQIRDYHYTYTDYREKKEIAEKKQKKQNQEQKPKKEKPKSTSNKPTYKQVKEYETLEKEIEDLEAEKEELMQKMGSGETDGLKLQEWSNRIGEIIKLVDEKTDRWMELDEVVNK